MKRHFFSFCLIRFFTFPLSFLPYQIIHKVGKVAGTLVYHLFAKYRKRALSNLALASDLNLSNKEIPIIAKKSIQNLMITCLEYAKLDKERAIANLATCENPKEAATLVDSGQGILFFCAHQANWEIFFLEGTSRMPGTAIGRPIANQILYNWILSIREKYDGKIITPRNAIREGLRALKRGDFLGIVGDQGMPKGGYSSQFLGREAWTSPIPAILAFRSNSPISVATMKRLNGKYHIHYSKFIWPNKEKSMEEEIPRMMKEILTLLEKSIKEKPEEWLWTHNKWKQEPTECLKNPFRSDSVGIILPEEKEAFEAIHPHLSIFRELYPREFILFMIPKKFSHLSFPKGEKWIYSEKKELFVTDYRCKLLFDLSNTPSLQSHFSKLSAITTASIPPSQEFPLALNKIVKRKNHAS